MTSLGIHQVHPTLEPSQTRTRVHQAMLVSGFLSSVIYIAADVVCSARYAGYSMLDQAISELSAVGAPTAHFWATSMIAYEVLFVLFAIAVFRSAGANRALRRTGIVLLAFAASGPLWSFFPMHVRGAERTWQDVGHLGMGALTIVLLLLFIGFGAFALGRRFRLYSFATMAAMAPAAVATFATTGRMDANLPTPWMGIVERVMIYGYLVWVAVLALGLVRHGQNSANAARS